MTGKLKKLMAAASALFLAGPGLSLAQVDSRPGRLIYPYAVGGVGDSTARFVAEALSKGLGRPFIVENRAGAGGRTGTRAVADAAPDGSTLGFVTVALLSVFPLVYPDLNYDVANDFAPVSQVARFDNAMATGPMVNAGSVADFVAAVKAKPAMGFYATPAAGSLPHFFAVSFADLNGIKLQHVPYAGPAPAINDVIAGQLPMVVSTTSDVAELHKAQKLRILATTGRQRSTLSPDVRTFRELGYDIEGYGWYAVVAPARTPPDVVARISAVIAETMRDSAGKARFERLGLEPTGTTPAELARIIQSDRERWAPVVKASGFTPAN